MFGLRRSRSILIGALVVLAAGVSVYWIKSAALEKQKYLSLIESRISTEENRIMVLEADWSYLTTPERIQRLSEEMLDFAPIAAERILMLENLDRDTPTPRHTVNAVSAGFFRITAQDEGR